MILVRKREDLHHSFAHDEGYLPHERHEPHAVDVTLEYSRPFRALKLWLAFRVHGAECFRAAIDGRVYLRPCIVNFRTSDADVAALVEIALEVGEALAEN